MGESATQELTLRDYALVVARRKWIVVAAMTASLFVALVLSFLQDAVYESSAQVLVRSRDNATIFTTTQTGTFTAASAVPTEIQVLESAVVASRVQQDLGLPGVPPRVKGSQVGVTDVVRAVVRSGDAVTAKVLADAYVNAYIAVKREQAVDGLLSGGEQISAKLTEIQGEIDAIDEQIANVPAESRPSVSQSLASQRALLVDQQGIFKEKLDQLQIDSQLANGGAQMLREAEVETVPVEPRPIRSALLALIVGLLIGLGAAFLIDYLDNSIRSPEELQRASGGLPLLGSIRHEVQPDSRPLSLSRPKSGTVESYRGLRTSLQFLSLDRDMKLIQFTSPMAGEGKSTTAVNTAVAFAQAGFRTLLVDADLRKPRQHTFFGLVPGTGLVEVLLGADYTALTHRILANLELLEAGRPPPNPSEMLSSRQMNRFLKQVRGEYDMVIVDSAPVLLVSDSIGLSSSVDAVVLVVRSESTSGPQVATAVGRLVPVDAPLIGTVMNDVSQRKSDQYGYGYGYGYGSLGGEPSDPITTPVASRSAARTSGVKK